MLRTQADTLRTTGDMATALRSRSLLRVAGIVAAAVLAATGELALAQALSRDAPRPHVALALVASLAVVGGVEKAALGAFAGGIALDVLAFRPLGVTAFGLLLADAAVAAVASPFTGKRRIVGLVAVIPLAITGGLVAAARSPAGVNAVDAFWRLLPGAAWDLAVALPLVVVCLAVRRRVSKEAAPSR